MRKSRPRTRNRMFEGAGAVMEMTFEVKRGEPVPPAKTQTFQPIYPFGEMKPGDYFDAPRDMGRNKSGKDARASSIGSSSRNWAKKHCIWAKFVTRLIDDKTVRCWRVT